MSNRILLEVAVASLEDARTAIAGGADRLELNCALELGGLTPTLSTVESVCALGTPTIIMARPRAGGFVYSTAEFQFLINDVAVALNLGAEGVAFGCLRSDRTVNSDWVAGMVSLAERTSSETVFHRAFDLTPDPFGALDILIDLGVTRVLTSGQAASASQGASLISRLIDYAAGRIEVLPGAGIRPENIEDLLARTGATQVHGSFSIERDDPAEPVCCGRYRATSREMVEAMRARL
jgi:copper homeostasis protein